MTVFRGNLASKKKGREKGKSSKNFVLQERWLTANYNAESLGEDQALLSKCLSLLKAAPSGSTKWCMALFTGLSLVTGRSQRRLMRLQFEAHPENEEWWGIEDGGIYLYYRPQIIRSDLEGFIEETGYSHLVNEVKTGPFQQPIPKSLGVYLTLWAKLSVLRRKEVGKIAGTIIKDLQEYDRRPYSPGRVASSLSYYLSTKKCGIADIGYLTGLSPRRCVALHYSQLKISDILPPLHRFLKELGFSDDEIPSVPDAVVGTALTIDDNSLSWMYRQQVKPLRGALADDIAEYVNRHNEIAYMTWVYFQLSTGHRHNVGALKSVLHFDLLSGLIIVEDKTTRPLVLSVAAVQQLKFYLGYLQNFKRQADLSQLQLAKHIEMSLNGDAPLFFLIDGKKQRKDFSVRNLKALVQKFWRFPPNWARHFTLTKLVTTLSADQFPAWAGHLEGQKEADDRFSGLGPVLQREASETMSRVLEGVGITPFNPCDWKLPEAPKVSLPEALKKLGSWNNAEKSRLKKEPESTNQSAPTHAYWTKERMQRCVSLLDWESKFVARLESLQINHPDIEAWMALTIYSAMTRGGLTKPEMVYALYTQLHRGGLQWWTVGGRSYVDLSSKVDKGPFNLRKSEDEAHRQLHWPVDMQTLCLLLAGPFCSSVSHHNLPNSRSRFFSWFSTWFVGASDRGINSLKELCRCVPYIQWFVLKADISYGDAYIAGPGQYNFAPNNGSLLSLHNSINRIIWRPVDNSAREKKKSVRKHKKGRLSSSFGEMAASQIRSLLVNTSIKASRNNIQNFIIHEMRDWTIETQLLVQWIEYKLSHIKVATAKDYLTSIDVEWFTAVQGHSFEELTADQILAVYQQIIEGTTDTNRRETYIQRLRWIHQFGVEEYGWPLEGELATFLKTSSSLTFVCTSIVDYRHVYNVLEALDQLDEDEIFRAQLKLILIFGFRCGVRIGEILKLRFRDIDPESNWAIYVRGSRLGSNKSDNSLRKLELASLLCEEELTLLKQYYHELKIDSDKADYLFGLGGQNIPLEQVKCSQILGGALRQSTGNTEVVFHSLRHSWASTSYAIVSEEWDLAKTLTGFDEDKLLALREHWLRSEDLARDGLWQIARALGHASPATSIQTYIHTIPEIMHQKLARSLWHPKTNKDTPMKLDPLQESLKKLLNFRQGELDELGYVRVMNRLAKKVRKNTGEKQKPVKKPRSIKPDLTFDLPATYLILAGALSKLAGGQELSSVIVQYPVSKSDLSDMLSRCRKLADIKTSTGAQKLVSNGGCEESLPAILPNLHKSPKVRQLAMEAANKLRKYCKKKRERKLKVRQALAVLKSFTVSQHQLVIYTREELNDIAGFSNGLLPNEFWKLELVATVKGSGEEVKRAENDILVYWGKAPFFHLVDKNFNTKRSRKNPSNENGIVYATLAHTKQEFGAGQAGRRLGVKMLGWLAYMTVVLYATNEEVEAFSGTIC
ncbi:MULTISPECIES: tyrosine-type recombinase/integrase [Kordiimonas]|jgi:integrase|uniref:tyrosine-type recombinase/integrase n=1 Tax=Kordiimonas TaxID=288021 RepID=UPI002580186B|nr:site-specific integrase [Kordiimonas sp. UBA4487]